MRVNSIHEQGPSIRESDIESLEGKLNVEFPVDYRQFLLSVNGGVPTYRLTSVSGIGDVLVDCLLGIGSNNDIELWLSELSGDLPVRFVPIGFDPGGNTFLLNTGNTRFQSGVYYWDSTRHFPLSTESNNTFWMADSFSAFLGGCRDG